MKKGFTRVMRAKIFSTILVVLMLIGGLNITPSVGKICRDLSNQSDPEIYPDENDMPESHQNSEMEVSVTTNKYTYAVGELVEITLEGNWSSLVSEITHMGYCIKDSYGNYTVEHPGIFGFCGNEPWAWWEGPEIYYWNQTYSIYESHYFLMGQLPVPVPPSQEQVSPGKYYVYVSINGREISEPAEFEIISANQPPVADAGPDQTAVVHDFGLTLLTFNGSGSYDPDGTILSYFWDFGDGTNNSGENVFHAYDTPGTYVVILTVTDDDGATATDYAIVTVTKASGSFRNIFTDKYSYNIGEPINITYSGHHGSSSSYTPPGPAKYHFIIKNEYNDTVVEVPLFWEISLMVAIQWEGTVTWIWNQSFRLYGENRTINDLIPPTGEQVPPGKYYAWFDTHYVWGLVGPAEFEIISANQPPVADAGEDVIIEINPLIPTAIFALNGSGSYDPDGTIVYYHWDFGDGTYGSGEIVLHSFPGPGNYTVELTVTDDDGATSTDSILVTVLIEPWQNLWTDKYRYCVGEPVVLTYKGIHDPYAPCPNHFLITNESGDIVFWFGPVYHPTVVAPVHGTVSYNWSQTYQMFDSSWLPTPPTGNQVPPGKYYAWYSEPTWPGFGPVEFEIVECPGLKIEKEKISGPDEVYTHTYNEWELKITVSGGDSNISYEEVIVYDVLPAELELLDYELTQGILISAKKGKGKMGSTHLTWNIGDLNGEAELILKIGTRKNPAGKQEFTSPGKYLLNDGASVEGTDSFTGKTIKVGPTDPIFVTVLKN